MPIYGLTFVIANWVSYRLWSVAPARIMLWTPIVHIPNGYALCLSHKTPSRWWTFIHSILVPNHITFQNVFSSIIKPFRLRNGKRTERWSYFIMSLIWSYLTSKQFILHYEVIRGKFCFNFEDRDICFDFLNNIWNRRCASCAGKQSRNPLISLPTVLKFL